MGRSLRHNAEIVSSPSLIRLAISAWFFDSYILVSVAILSRAGVSGSVQKSAVAAIFASIFAFFFCVHVAHADIASNLAGYWGLNETSGTTAADSSGSGNTGTVTGTADWVGGKFDNAFNFDGSSYIEISRPVQDDFTMCAWFQTTAVGGGGAHFEFMAILDSEVPVVSVGDFGFGIDSDGRLGYGGGGDGGLDFVNVLTPDAVNDGLWHQGCVTRKESDGTANLYLDGSLADTDTLATGSLDANPVMRIGGFQDDGGNAKNFDGLLDDVRIYSRVLDSAEITALYQLDPTIHQSSAAAAGSAGLPWCSGPLAPGWNVSLPGGGCGALQSAAVAAAPPARVAHCPSYPFVRTLRLGSEGEDVKALQKLMNCLGFTISDMGPGSPGEETDRFADRTLAAVKKFQEAYAADILAPIREIKGTGIFAAYSQKKAKELAGQ
jgi:hypothetical protein